LPLLFDIFFRILPGHQDKVAKRNDDKYSNGKDTKTNHFLQILQPHIVKDFKIIITINKVKRQPTEWAKGFASHS